MKIGMQIIPIAEAKAFPVGEAQEEPNQNPYLEKPKLGRGISDFFKGSFFDFSFGKCILYIKIFLGIVIVLLVVFILFIKPGIMV